MFVQLALLHIQSKEGGQDSPNRSPEFKSSNQNLE